MRLDQFPAFFKEVTGYKPYPWQRRLAGDLMEGRWPSTLGLPTGAGKTSVLVVVVFALAAGARVPRRLLWVVDRRTIIDEVKEFADGLAERLEKAETGVLREAADALRRIGGTSRPLLVTALRGGMVRTREWAESISQPSILCSTVDQVGSRLLFRGYGEFKHRSVHAGLVANDCLWILDEVQLSRPFLQTLNAVRTYREEGETFGLDLRCLSLSATPGTEPDFVLDAEDEVHPVLGPRLATVKRTEFVRVPHQPTQALPKIVDLALKGWGWEPKTVAVVVNTTKLARDVYERLAKKVSPERVALMIGRARPHDRDALVEKWRPLIEVGARAMRADDAEPIYIVATQCIEAGVNFDFDAMVMQSASIDAVLQRAGRVERTPNPKAKPDYVKIRLFGSPNPEFEDWVYGKRERATWFAFEEWSETENIDLGRNGFEKNRHRFDPDLCMSGFEEPPVLLPAHLNVLARTSPSYGDAPAPDLSTLLHGPATSAAEVQVAWRSDLSEGKEDRWAERVSEFPPLSPELAPIPYRTFQAWMTTMGGLKQTDQMSDLETDPVPPAGFVERQKMPPSWQARASIRVLRRVLGGRDHGSFEVVTGDDIRPGDTVVLPSWYGGLDRYGFDMDYREPVTDIAEQVWREQRGRGIVRVVDDTIDDYLPDDHPGIREAERKVPNAYRIDHHGWSLFLERAEKKAAVSKDTDRTLATHLRMTGEYADENARTCGLAGGFVEALHRGGVLHDLGKADPRFQAWLNGGRRLRREDPLLAKSRGQSPALRRAALKASGYPIGARHEGLSMALAASNPEVLAGFEDEDLKDLILHLVGAHHGACRPALPVTIDAEPIDVKVDEGIVGVAMQANTDHGLERIGSGIATRFDRLLRRFGWWGLSYLEAALVLADSRHSREITNEE